MRQAKRWAKTLLGWTILFLFLGSFLHVRGYVYEDEFDEDSFPDIAFQPAANTSSVDHSDASPSIVKGGRLDQVMDPRTRAWTYMDMAPNVTIENAPMKEIVKDAALQEFALLVVRKLEAVGSRNPPSFRIILLHKHIIEICKKIVGPRPGLSWNQVPMDIDPDILLSYYDDFARYRDELKASDSDEAKILTPYIGLLISTLDEDYATTLSALGTMRKNAETTFDTLKYILRPRDLLYFPCPLTGLPRLCELSSFSRRITESGPAYQLQCDSIDLVDVRDSRTNPLAIDMVQVDLSIPHVDGVVKVDSLPVYPVKYHPDRHRLMEEVIARGKKWTQLVNVRHMQYEGVAGFKENGWMHVKQHVNSRIMIDRASFFKRHMNYWFPDHVGGAKDRKFARNWDLPQSSADQIQEVFKKDGSLFLWDLTREDLLLTPTIVYGFSLADKRWFEFSVEKVMEIEWNDDAFPNLVLPPARKELLRSLVEAHSRDSGVEDFVRGKGQGLVINLFGPPGVGKTMSAEATSEHIRRPLFTVGSGDLGTDAQEMDTKLKRIFELSTSWGAIVLIDEADVFMERRSLHELQRNALVAVFLRHIEYYRGILFLTTNRVQTFDAAFLSRIHVALHFGELDLSARAKVWTAFINKLGMLAEIPESHILELAARPINGRQIKNAVRTAQSLALGRGEKLHYQHLVDTLQAMVEFNEEFKAQKI